MNTVAGAVDNILVRCEPNNVVMRDLLGFGVEWVGKRKSMKTETWMLWLGVLLAGLAAADAGAADRSWVGYGGPGSELVVPEAKPPESKIGELCREARKGGVNPETWRYSCSGGSVHCIGQAHATPVSDGERVYVQTPLGGPSTSTLTATCCGNATCPRRPFTFDGAAVCVRALRHVTCFGNPSR